MSSELTTPIQLDESDSLPSQAVRGMWSFGTTHPVMIAEKADTPNAEPISASEQIPPNTLAPQRLQPPGLATTVISTLGFGKRSMYAEREWEGVVERVEKDEFTCKLFPIGKLKTDTPDPELTSFSFDELSRDDWDLVAPGTVLYWSVGPAMNAAGSFSHVSLIRVKRTIGPSLEEQKRSSEEAKALFSVLAGESDAPLS